MRCPSCERADLLPERIVFEHSDSSGRTLRQEMDGFRCPSCGEVLLMGRDAERFSGHWYALGTASTPSVPADSASTNPLPLVARGWAWAEPQVA